MKTKNYWSNKTYSGCNDNITYQNWTKKNKTIQPYHWEIETVKPKHHYIWLIVGIAILALLSLAWADRAKSTHNEVKTTPQAQILPLQPTVEPIKIASWYDYSLNGVEWSKKHSTCASRTLPRYSIAKVTAENGKSVICYVNDLIEHPNRDIDLSSYAFSQLADLKIGLLKVKIELLNN